MPKEKKNRTGPLTGTRILDLTRLYPGPLGAMLMADMGADVIKIENLSSPDYIRNFPPFINSESAGYLAVNRSKRSLALNLRVEEGRNIFFDLVKSADVVVEQFRPGVIDRIGIGYQQACEYNPGIIYVSVTGYGQDGSYADQAGHDINYIGYAGILGATGTKQTGPIAPAAQIADVAGGAYMTAIACLSALWARERTGKGQHVDVAMLDSVLPLMTMQLAHYWATNFDPGRGELPLSGGFACYGVYRCADGKHVALGALEPKFWEPFCELIGKPEWQKKLYSIGEEKEALKDALQKLFARKTRDEWLELAQEKDVCLTPIYALDEVENDPHLNSRGMIYLAEHPVAGKIKSIGVPIKFSHTPAEPAGPPPELGEHTVEVLREAGYIDKEIEELQKKKIVYSCL